MQRAKTDGARFIRSGYERALAEVAREHARAKAAQPTTRIVVAAAPATSVPQAVAKSPA